MTVEDVDEETVTSAQKSPQDTDGAMHGSTNLGRDCLLAAGALVVVPAAGALFHAWYASGLIDAAHAGQSGLDWLNRFFAARMEADPGTYDLEHFHWMGRTMATRLSMLWAILIACWLGWRHRNALGRGLKGFITERDLPFNLGIFRIVVFWMLLSFGTADDLALYSSLPASMHFPPVGLGPVLAKLPANPDLAAMLTIIFQIGCVLGMLGFLTRPVAVVVTILALYLLGLPQMFGKVNHSHHLVWFAAILATSRCGDALSIDALIRRWRGRPDPVPALGYALPLRITWILLGLIYFFPGFWKLWGGGMDWIFGDHLRYQMYHLWSTHEDYRTMTWLSESKLLVTLGGIGTIAFELLFIVLVLGRRTRLIAALAGICFHASMAIVLRIGFFTLQISYISLIDWRRLFERIGLLTSRPFEPGGATRAGAPSPIPVAIMGVIIVVPVLLFGFRGENNGWPFACYPRFSYPIFEPERDRIEYEVVDATGTIKDDDGLEEVRRRFRTARWIGLLRRTLQTSGEDLQQRLGALYRLGDSEPDPGDTIRFYRTTYSTIPENWGDPPIHREILAEIRMNPDR